MPEEMRRGLASGRSPSAGSARAVVFALLGWAIVVGWFRDASEVGTTVSSFRTLAEQPGALGRWLRGVTAGGFVADGFYEIIHARYLPIRRAHVCPSSSYGFTGAVSPDVLVGPRSRGSVLSS